MAMTLQRAALWAIVFAATMYLLVAGRGLLLPFVLGIVLWYMVDALADAFEQPRLAGCARRGRWAAGGGCVTGGLLWIVGRTIAATSPRRRPAPAYEPAAASPQRRRAHGRYRAGATSASCSTASAGRTLSSLATAAASVVSIAGIVLIYPASCSSSRCGSVASSRSSSAPAAPARCPDQIDRDIRVYIRIRPRRCDMALAYTVMAFVGVDFAAFWAVMVAFLLLHPDRGPILAIAAGGLTLVHSTI
jgi:hypothetical protein